MQSLPPPFSAALFLIMLLCGTLKAGMNYSQQKQKAYLWWDWYSNKWMWKSLSVEDQEQPSAVCLWVCVCDYCSICELIRSRMSTTRELLQFGVVEVHTARCITDTSTHTVGGNCTERCPQHTSLRLSSKRILNTYLGHFFLQCSWRCTLTPPCRSFIFIFFYFGTLGWLFIRCALVETCETNILTATCLFKFHSLSVIFSLGLLIYSMSTSNSVSICNILLLFPKQDGIFIPAKLLLSFCIVSVLQEGGLGIGFVVCLLTN